MYYVHRGLQSSPTTILIGPWFSLINLFTSTEVERMKGVEIIGENCSPHIPQKVNSSKMQHWEIEMLHFDFHHSLRSIEVTRKVQIKPQLNIIIGLPCCN